MLNSFLVISLMSMYFTTGSVPQQMSHACYNQLETQKYVDAIEYRYVSPNMKRYGGDTLLIMNVVFRQKIEYRIEF